MKNHDYALADGIKDVFKTSHNACYSIPHIDVSYWFAVDRSDFSVSDVIGEFSIIDPAFQVSTYGCHLCSDFSYLHNYVIRRCFCEVENYFPVSLEGKDHSFAVLKTHFPSEPNKSTVYDCRCYFHDELARPFDFQLSIGLTVVKQQKKGK